MKVFIGGISGSGKTTLASKISKEYGLTHVIFDNIYRYDLKPEGQCSRVFNSLTDNFVIDAFPFAASENNNYSWEKYYEQFERYAKNNECEIILSYCGNFKTWYDRYMLRGSLRDMPNISIRLLKEHVAFIEYFKGQTALNVTKYYDSDKDEYTSKSEYDLSMLSFVAENQKLQEKCENVRLHVYAQKYDNLYGDIELINMVGYSESWKTWYTIMDAVKWKGKTVCDIGSYHGYFSFKAAMRGASVTGLEAREDVIATAQIINDIYGNVCKFEQWYLGQAVPKCDIILCLNVLHYSNDIDAALAKFDCDEAIFEIKKEQVSNVLKFFNIINEMKSHRENRVILHCKKIR